jgi:type IV pilus assembly protein PilB
MTEPSTEGGGVPEPASEAGTTGPVLDRKRLGDLIVDAGLATREQVESAAAVAIAEGRLIGEVLRERMIAEESDIYRSLARLHGVPFAGAEELLEEADASLARSVPRKFLEHHQVLPVSRSGETVVVATCEVRPDLPELAEALGAQILEYRLVTPTDFRRLRMALDLEVPDVPHESAERTLSAHDLLRATDGLEAASVEFFDAILLEAIALRASDIHLERYGDKIRFRLRIDGDLHDTSHLRITPAQYLGVVNVVKVKAGLDIAERRLPQGGRFSTAAGGRIYDLRVQTQPAFAGEHVVIRLLSKETEMLFIEQLGLPDSLASAYRRLLATPSGLILVVGPTGCGKSTTLYAGLSILSRDETRKVITIEDPIECPIDDIQQTQVRPEIGFAFANAMRAFVRQDPDVILVGEIRDAETALEAIRASQTGHLVLSTLHTNDSPGAVQRLLDLGMQPNSIASELLAVFAQRLAKRICQSCRAEVEPDSAILGEIFPEGRPPGFRSFRGAGCSHCGGYGSFGRVAVVEHLDATRALRRSIAMKLAPDALRAAAEASGFEPMREHALRLVGEGIVALEELPVMFSLEQLKGRSGAEPQAA